MIALPAAKPLIRFGSEQLAVYESAWLTKTLTDATDGTNIPSWMAEDLSKGVEAYLEHHYPGSVIDSDELFSRIRDTLEKVGLTEVAENLEQSLPPVKISLTELANRAGSGFELAFFQMLESRVQDAAENGAGAVECYGLESCVKQLASAKKWTGECEQLKTEITAFLDQKLTKASHHMPSFSMQVHQ
ncbi:MAG: hypothetical protein HKN23_21985 [Verrucomicrobiales bacterium]|nr:hypothetical protein [Verrucomicrobiales bacterium]